MPALSVSGETISRAVTCVHAEVAPADSTAATQILPVASGDGSRFELICVAPPGAWRTALFWMPAMGVPARHYLPLAEVLAAHGVAVALHEWRGLGSSNRRAGRRADWGYRELLQLDLPAARAALHALWPHATWVVGGHSLGGQLAMLHAALAGAPCAGVALVASGAPYWRAFRHGRWLAAAYALAPVLARLCGHLPGRRIGFGGNEARGVIADAEASVLTGAIVLTTPEVVSGAARSGACTGMFIRLKRAPSDTDRWTARRAGVVFGAFFGAGAYVSSLPRTKL